MKSLLLDICTQENYTIGKNFSGITMDILIDGIIENSVIDYVRKETGCTKDAVTRVIRNTFTDRQTQKY